MTRLSDNLIIFILNLPKSNLTACALFKDNCDDRPFTLFPYFVFRDIRCCLKKKCCQN
ncbi:hypothetical protein BH23VER1_BH23VER1_19650 [soil metagenome]